jgi:hypothetical protein
MQSIVSDSFSTPTLLGSQLGLQAILPIAFNTQKEFTLNSQLGIFPNQDPQSMPKLRYFCVGTKGAYNTDDEDGSSAYDPKRTEMNLYNLIPIRCRPVDDDLTDAERAKYRLRTRAKLNDGNEYFLYYAKALEFSGEIQTKKVNSLTGEETAYELSAENLSPTPVKTSTSTLAESIDSEIVSYYDTAIRIEAKEILEYINVVYGGDTRKAKISEIGLLTGDDQEVSGLTTNNVAITYTEAIYTQLYNKICMLAYPLTRPSDVYLDNFQITSSGAISRA